MQSVKNLKEEKRNEIHNVSLDIINLFNLDNNTISNIIGCKENTAAKKKLNHENKVFTYNDLTNLYLFMDNQIRSGMLKRRQIKNFLDFVVK